jgi:hypothetical protein
MTITAAIREAWKAQQENRAADLPPIGYWEREHYTGGTWYKLDRHQSAAVLEIVERESLLRAAGAKTIEFPDEWRPAADDGTLHDGGVTVKPHRLTAILPVSTFLLEHGGDDGPSNDEIAADLGELLGLRETLGFHRGNGENGEPVGIWNTPSVVTLPTVEGLDGIAKAAHDLRRRCVESRGPRPLGAWTAFFGHGTLTDLEPRCDLRRLVINDDDLSGTIDGWLNFRVSTEIRDGDVVVGDPSAAVVATARVLRFTVAQGPDVVERYPMWKNPQGQTPQEDPDWFEERTRGQVFVKAVLEHDLAVVAPEAFARATVTIPAWTA